MRQYVNFISEDILKNSPRDGRSVDFAVIWNILIDKSGEFYDPWLQRSCRQRANISRLGANWHRRHGVRVRGRKIQCVFAGDGEYEPAGRGTSIAARKAIGTAWPLRRIGSHSCWHSPGGGRRRTIRPYRAAA